MGCSLASTLSSESIGSKMFDAGETFRWRAADALGGRFRRDEVGKFLLQLLQLLEKPVVFVVGELRLADDVIGVVVPADFVGELRRGGLGLL